MNDILEQALLYDFYGELLTSHQKEIYEQFVLEDLSLSEIAGEAGISRQGVHDLVSYTHLLMQKSWKWNLKMNLKTMTRMRKTKK